MTMYFRDAAVAERFLALCTERAIAAHVTRNGQKLVVDAQVPRGARSKFVAAWAALSMEVPGQQRRADAQLTLRWR